MESTVSEVFIAWKKSTDLFENLSRDKCYLSPEEIKRSFLIRNIPNLVSLQDLFRELSVFGLVRDLCVTKRQNRVDVQRFARVEFREKESADKFFSNWQSSAFFKNFVVESLFIPSRPHATSPRNPLGYTRED
jgi:hypothetical protein